MTRSTARGTGDVASRDPIDRGDEESTIRASVAELRRKREQEGDPFAEQKAPIIERAYLAHHGAKALREASHDLRQRHRLERNDAQFIQGLARHLESHYSARSDARGDQR